MTATSEGELVRLLLPRVLEHLQALSGDLRAAEGAPVESARRVEQLGWVLGVLSSAAGADLLLARRESRGLELIGELIAETVPQVEWRPPGDTPRLAPDVGEGWELAWVCGSLLLESALGLPRGATMRWDWEGDGGVERLESRAPVLELDPRVERVLTERLPEARLELRADGWSLTLPVTWFGADA